MAVCALCLGVLDTIKQLDSSIYTRPENKLATFFYHHFTVMRCLFLRPPFLLFSIWFFWRLIIRGVSSARRNELRRTNHRWSATGTLTAGVGNISISWGQDGAASTLERSNNSGAATTAVGGEGCVFFVVSRIYCQCICQQPRSTRATKRPPYTTTIKSRARRIKMTSYYCYKAFPQA